MDDRTIKGVTHFVYDDVEEFRKYHPDTPIVENWREGQEGDWVLTDDDQVVQVLHRAPLKQKPTNKSYVDYIRTILGSVVCRPTVELGGDQPENIYTFSPRGDAAWKQIKYRDNVTADEFMFSKNVVKGMHRIEAYIDAFETENRDYADTQSKLLLKTERIQKLIDKQIAEFLDDSGMSVPWIFEQMKLLILDPETKDSAKVALLKEIGEYHKIKGDTSQKQQVQATIYRGFTPKQLEAVNNGETEQLSEIAGDNSDETLQNV